MAKKVTSNYLWRVYEPRLFQALVKRTTEALSRLDARTPFDAIAFTGMSGAALAYPVSFLLKKRLICVRKAADDSHYQNDTDNEFEGYHAAKAYIILDDCVETGDTLRRIEDIVSENSKAQLVGVYLYDHVGDKPVYKKIPIMVGKR